MPIGTVDYTSTAPWNDPYNPWPAYAQVSLSAADTALNDGGNAKILTLVSFDPNAYLDEAAEWTYQSADGVQLFFNSFSGAVYVFADNGYYYELPTTHRGIPAGYVQGNATWSAFDQGTDAASLSIIPVTTYLNPWEYRRRRLLEIV